MAGAAPSSKPAPFLKPVDTIDRGVLLAESALSLVVVVAMVGMAVGESATRLIAMALTKWASQASLDSFLQKSAPVSRYAGDFLMHGTLWAAFLGASFATRGRRHLAIDVLGRLLPPRGKHFMAAVANTMGAVIAFALSKGIYGALMEAVHTATQQAASARESGLDISTIDRSFEFQFVIPAGFLLIALRLLLHGYHEFVAGFRNDDKVAEKPAEAETSEEESKDDAELHARLGPPVAYATATEIVIAVVTLFAMVVPSIGTVVFKSLLVSVLLAAPTLLVPLALRKRNHGNYGPTMPREADPEVKWEASHLAMAAVGVGGVLLAAKMGGVFERMGHTEGSVDLMKMAGLKSGAVLCELMNPDGSMPEQVTEPQDQGGLAKDPASAALSNVPLPGLQQKGPALG